MLLRKLGHFFCLKQMGYLLPADFADSRLFSITISENQRNQRANFLKQHKKDGL
jgi:hypothetical protein